MDPVTTTTGFDYSALKALVPLAVPAIKTTIEDWLSPVIETTFKNRDVAKNSKPERVAKSFEDYLLRTYARLSFMNTIVFGNQQKRIQDLYIPLTVVRSGPDQKAVTIHAWQEDFIPNFKRVVITDTAGMGKSTILKWLFLCAMGTSKRIPIFIELRTLSATKSILDKIYDDLCPIDKPFDKDLLLHLIKSGQFIFFLDGFDEVSFEDRRIVTEDVQTFIRKAFGNQFAIASRHESALASFGEFQEFTIKPLSKEEAYLLLRKYDETQEHAEALIAELEASKYQQLKDLMTNPMLVSLLYKAYSYKPKVPFKKQIFYRQVFDALFDMHDSTKGGAFVRKKHSGLDIDEFHLVMRDLGFTTAKLGKIEYEKDEICDIIKRVRERNTTILFQPTALLNDLITTVPLFNKEGDHFKWAHKSVQDYFASQYIAVDAKGNEEALLKKIYDAGHCQRFENMLDLLHDTDNKSFRRVLLAQLLEDYVKHYETRYIVPFPGISAKALEDRKQLSFGQEIGIVRFSTKKLDRVLDEGENLETRYFGEMFKSLPQARRAVNLHMVHINQSSAYLLGIVTTSATGLLSLLVKRAYPYVGRQDNFLQHATKHSLKIPIGTPYFIADDPDSPINRPENFELINAMLGFNGYKISLDQAKRTLSSIREESDESTQINQLLQNL